MTKNYRRWTREEDALLLRHVVAMGTGHWGGLGVQGQLPHRDNKACCNRFILLKRKYLGITPEWEAQEAYASLLSAGAPPAGGLPPPPTAGAGPSGASPSTNCGSGVRGLGRMRGRPGQAVQEARRLAAEILELMENETAGGAAGAGCGLGAAPSADAWCGSGAAPGAGAGCGSGVPRSAGTRGGLGAGQSACVNAQGPAEGGATAAEVKPPPRAVQSASEGHAGGGHGTGVAPVRESTTPPAVAFERAGRASWQGVPGSQPPSRDQHMHPKQPSLLSMLQAEWHTRAGTARQTLQQAEPGRPPAGQGGQWDAGAQAGVGRAMPLSSTYPGAAQRTSWSSGRVPTQGHAVCAPASESAAGGMGPAATAQAGVCGGTAGAWEGGSSAAQLSAVLGRLMARSAAGSGPPERPPLHDRFVSASDPGLGGLSSLSSQAMLWELGAITEPRPLSRAPAQGPPLPPRLASLAREMPCAVDPAGRSWHGAQGARRNGARGDGGIAEAEHALGRAGSGSLGGSPFVGTGSAQPVKGRELWDTADAARSQEAALWRLLQQVGEDPLERLPPQSASLLPAGVGVGSIEGFAGSSGAEEANAGIGRKRLRPQGSLAEQAPLHPLLPIPPSSGAMFQPPPPPTASAAPAPPLFRGTPPARPQPTPVAGLQPTPQPRLQPARPPSFQDTPPAPLEAGAGPGPGSRGAGGLSEREGRQQADMAALLQQALWQLEQDQELAPETCGLQGGAGPAPGSMRTASGGLPRQGEGAGGGGERGGGGLTSHSGGSGGPKGGSGESGMRSKAPEEPQHRWPQLLPTTRGWSLGSRGYHGRTVQSGGSPGEERGGSRGGSPSGGSGSAMALLRRLLSLTQSGQRPSAAAGAATSPGVTRAQGAGDLKAPQKVSWSSTVQRSHEGQEAQQAARVGAPAWGHEAVAHSLGAPRRGGSATRQHCAPLSGGSQGASGGALSEGGVLQAAIRNVRRLVAPEPELPSPQEHKVQPSPQRGTAYPMPAYPLPALGALEPTAVVPSQRMTAGVAGFGPVGSEGTMASLARAQGARSTVWAGHADGGMRCEDPLETVVGLRQVGGVPEFAPAHQGPAWAGVGAADSLTPWLPATQGAKLEEAGSRLRDSLGDCQLAHVVAVARNQQGMPNAPPSFRPLEEELGARFEQHALGDWSTEMLLDPPAWDGLDPCLGK